MITVDPTWDPMELVGAEVELLLLVDSKDRGWLDDPPCLGVMSGYIELIRIWNMASCG